MRYLEEAIKNKKVLFRKVGPPSSAGVGKIEYKTYFADKVQDMEKDGSYWTDCNFDFFSEEGDPTPYMDLPLPFDPDLLKETCGSAGWGYYVEDPDEDEA